MVNEGDGKGRKATNVVRLRAVFTDDDGKAQADPPSTAAAPASLVVQSASGRHSYWRLEEGADLSAFSATQKALAKHFGTDPKVHDLPRVMRVPGFFHLKDRASPFLVRVLEVAEHRYTIKQVVDAFSLEIEEPTAPTSSRTPRVRQVAGQVAITSVDSAIAVRRARAYLAKVPGAKQGERDATAYTVACVLVRDFALPQEVALGLLREWNDEKIDPPLEEADLVAKLEHAANYATGEVGAKLDVDPGDFEGADDLCFVIPHDRYYFRRPDGRWEAGLPLDAERGQTASADTATVPARTSATSSPTTSCHLHRVWTAHPARTPLFVRDGDSGREQLLAAGDRSGSRRVPSHPEHHPGHHGWR